MSPKQASDRRFSPGDTLRRILGWFSKNLLIKLVALLIALFLWAVLIIQDPSITREKVFNDVSVTVSGEETMKRNGYIVVSDLGEALSGVTVRADVPQMQYQAAAATAYNARVDLSRIRETGVQSVRILTTNSATYGSVNEVSPAEVEVTVEEYVSRYRIPVTLITEGATPDGYYATTPSLDPARVTVSGPRSIAEKVVRAEATLDLSSLPAREGTVRTAVSFRLIDAEGNEVSDSLLEVTSESILLDSVIAEQSLYAMKELTLSEIGLVQGIPADGYEIKQIQITPAVVTGAGKADSLSTLDDLFAETHVDVTGASESLTEQLRIRRPSELTWISTDSISVAVEIGPIITERTFSGVKVSLTGVAGTLRGKLDATTADVTLTGEQNALAKLRANQITLQCDASGLTAGVYDLPVQCTVDGFEAKAIPETIRVTLTER